MVARKRSSTMQRQKRQGIGRHQSFGGSELTMQVERFRSSVGSSSKAGMIKKPEQHHMLTNLSKVQAEVYINTSPTGDIGSKPSTPSKEASNLRRSFSLRKPKANKQLRKGGGTLRGSPGTRGSCMFEEGQATWIADQDATKMYFGLSQQHLDALGLGSSDIPLTPASTVPKRNGMADEAVLTFRAPKATRERPMSLLLHRWEGRHSPKSNRAPKRFQVLGSAGNPSDVSGSSGDLRTSSPSQCSSLSSSFAVREKSNRPADLAPPWSKEEMQEKEGSMMMLEVTERDVSTSSSTLSKVGVGSALLSCVLEPYLSGSVSGIQSGQTSEGESSVVEGDAGGGGGATEDAGLVPIEEVPRQDSLITVGLDSLSLLSLDDACSGQADKVPNGFPVSVWQDSPLFTECQCPDDAHAKSDESQVIGLHHTDPPHNLAGSGLHHTDPPHNLAGSGKQTQVENWLSPLASLSQGVEIKTSNSHHQPPSETLDLSSHNQSIEILDHKSCSQPFEMLHSQHSGTAPIVIQSANTKLFADSQTPISTPLDQCQPPITTPFAHSNPSNSMSHAIQAELTELNTTIHNSKSATIPQLPYLQPLNVTPGKHSVLSPPVEAALLQSSQPDTKMDFPVIPGVDVYTVGHQTEPKTLFVAARDAKTVETPLVRQNLLEAIRAGIQLRKVTLEERSRSTADTSLLAWDVAAILERRMALSESDNDSDVTESDWEGEW